MRRHADFVQAREQVFRNPVVDDALAFDHLVLLGVEGGGVVLEVLDERARLRTLVEDLGFAFVDASAAVHAEQPWLEEIHLDWPSFPAIPPFLREARAPGARSRRSQRRYGVSDRLSQA